MTFLSRFFSCMRLSKSSARSIKVAAGSLQTKACLAASSRGVAKNFSANPWTLSFTCARKFFASSLFAADTLSSFFEGSLPKLTAGSFTS